MPAIFLRDPDLAAIAFIPFIIVIVPVTIYLTRGVVSQTNMATHDIKSNCVEIFELAIHPGRYAEPSDCEEEVQDVPARLPQLIRTASGRVINPEELRISRLPELPEAVAVTPTDDQSSLVRDLTEEEQSEIRRAIDRASRLWQAATVTLFLPIALGTDASTWLYRAPVVVICGIIAVGLWIEHYRYRHIRHALSFHLSQKVVTRIEECEYLGNDENRVLWSANGVPAPWRRFSG